MKDLKVEDVMTCLVVTFRPGDSVHDAAVRLLRNRISGAPVVEGGKLVGIVSETDFMRIREPDRVTVGDVMTREVVTITTEASVWEAASRLHRRGVRRLPVVDSENFVVGVVARADLVRAMARSDRRLEATA